MGSKIVTAVSHCGQDQPKLLVALGIRVRDAMYSTAGAVLYPSPPVTLTVFTAQVGTADTTQGNAAGRGTGATTTRNTGATTLFTSLDKLKLYANLTWKGNAANLRASGFYLSTDPVPHGIPAVPVIKEIKKGKLALSAKILLAKTTSVLNQKKESCNNIVQTSATGLAGSFTTVLQIKNMHKLVIPNLTYNKEMWYQVARSNAAGQSAFSTPVPYIGQ
ncbi:MAG TPA: hypothetical protein VF411_00215 [Bacteroidia bacterium]